MAMPLENIPKQSDSETSLVSTRFFSNFYWMARLCFAAQTTFRAEKTMTTTDVTGFDAIFPLDFSLLSPDFRGLVLLNCT